MFRSCQIIIRELCSLLKLCYSFRFMWPCIVSKLWSERENQQDATIRCLLSTLLIINMWLLNLVGLLSHFTILLLYSKFNWYLQTRCCGSISCCVGMCCGAVASCVSYVKQWETLIAQHRYTLTQHDIMLCRSVLWNSGSVCVVYWAMRVSHCSTYDTQLATAPQHIPTQHDMLPQHLICKYQLNCEYYNITLARN